MARRPIDRDVAGPQSLQGMAQRPAATTGSKYRRGKRRFRTATVRDPATPWLSRHGTALLARVRRAGVAVRGAVAGNLGSAANSNHTYSQRRIKQILGLH